MITEILDKMLLAYYIYNVKQPSKIRLNFSLEKPLESEFKAITGCESTNYQKYKGIPLEYNIREDFISLEK